MSGLTGKIVSTWLTETDERGLQAAFCHALILRGWKVVHSTTHNANEMGKDIIALDERKRLHVFQLKVNRGSVITMTDYRSAIQLQVPDLTQGAVTFPGIKPRRPDFAYIVANVNFHELVHAQVNAYNLTKVGAPLALFGEIQLLSELAQAVDVLLPADVRATQAILKILLDDGLGEFPVEAFAPVVERIVDEGLSTKSKTPAVRNCIAKLGAMTEVAAGPWRRKQNHLGVAQAYATCFTACLLACAKTGRLEACLDLLDFLVTVIADSLRDLVHEVQEHDVGIITRTNEYGLIGRAKASHVMGLAAMSALLDHETVHPSCALTKEYASKVIQQLMPNRFIWGEPAAPQVFVTAIFLERFHVGKIADEYWHWAIHAIVSACSGGGRRYFPPWETLDGENTKWLLGLTTGGVPQARGSYWANAFVLAGVRLNLRSLVKSIWPLISVMGRLVFTPDNPVDFFRYQCKEGKNQTLMRKLPTGWQQLVTEVKKTRIEVDAFKKRPYYYLVMLMVYPHRIHTNTLIALLPRYLDGKWH